MTGMLPLMLALWWGVVIAMVVWGNKSQISRPDYPILLLLLPQTIAMALIPILAHFGLVIPAVTMELHHFLFLFVASTLLVTAIAVGASGPPEVAKNPDANMGSSIPFWICFAIGGFGTVMLLRNLGVTSPMGFYIMVSRDFNTLEDEFFSGSSAILWQANIAAFFWFNTVARPNMAMKVALGLCLIFIFARGALLYIIISVAYYLVSFLRLRGQAKFPVKPVVFFLAFTQVVFFLSYSFEGNPMQIYFEKTYPYLSGNFINLFRHIDIAFGRSMLEIESFDDLFQSMGFSSIRVYMDRYFGLGFEPYDRMIFYVQAENAHVYGNTHSLYGQLVYLPLVVGIPFIFCLGLLIGRMYRLASSNLFYLSIHCWLSAATFLSFAGAGHFTTTRFFPALLFIWPFLIYRSAISLPAGPAAENVRSSGQESPTS